MAHSVWLALVLGLGLGACGPRYVSPASHRAPSVSSCSTSRVEAASYLAIAAAGVAATAAMWPQIDDARRDTCADCGVGTLLLAAPAFVGTTALGLGVDRLHQADRCRAESRLRE